MILWELADEKQGYLGVLDTTVELAIIRGLPERFTRRVQS